MVKIRGLTSGGSVSGIIKLYLHIGRLLHYHSYVTEKSHFLLFSFWQVTIRSSSSFQLVFEGIRGASYQGDIAIDDVELLDNPCPPPGDCNFEGGTCTWVNVPKTDDFDWLRGSGSTTSFNTGPPTDHTTNSAAGKSK